MTWPITNTGPLADAIRDAKRLYKARQQAVEKERKAARKTRTRRYHVLYWSGTLHERPVSRGYAKTLSGGTLAALRAIGWGYVPKVQLLDAVTGEVVRAWAVDSKGDIKQRDFK